MKIFTSLSFLILVFSNCSSQERVAEDFGYCSRSRANPGIEEANEELWILIQKFESMGIDFVGYEYRN